MVHKHKFHFGEFDKSDGEWNTKIQGAWFICECGELKYVKKKLKEVVSR